MSKKQQRVIYYDNELEDEFSSADIQAKIIDETYSYKGGWLRKAIRAIVYHGVGKWIAWICLKVAFGHRIVNKKVLRQVRNKAYFQYGNHTNAVADAIIPTMIHIRRGTYVIVHPNNVSMPVLGKLTPALGAIPLPDTKQAMKNFSRDIREKMEKKKLVTIYPEAHIWPYYTKIRPFRRDSFGYPVQYGVPVICFTNTYQKRRFGKKPRIVTYLDGPFYPDETLSRGEQKEKLRNQVYDAMVRESKHNTVEWITYRKKETAE